MFWLKYTCFYDYLWKVVQSFHKYMTLTDSNEVPTARQSDKQPLLFDELLECIIYRLATSKIPIFLVTKSL